MAKKQEVCEMCPGCHGKKSKGWTMLILGIIALINAYMPFMSWGALIGIVLVILGIIKLAMPCECCK